MGNIDMYYKYLPTLENYLVVVQEAVAQSIFRDNFGKYGLCYRRTYQIRNTRSEIILVVIGGVSIRPTFLQMFKIFLPQGIHQVGYV